MDSSSSSAYALGERAKLEPAVESLGQISSELEWNQLFLQGSLPPARYKHAAVAIGRKMFVTGGILPEGKVDDVQVFHAEKLAWEKLSCQSLSPDLKSTRGKQQDVYCRSCTGHGLVFWEEQFVLVGCQTKHASKSVTVLSLSLSSRSWSTLSPKGNPPAMRTGHTVVQMASMLVLFGGEDRKGHTLNDIYILDLKTLLWLPLETSGTKPSPRRDHCAASYSERYLWIFGGKSKVAYYNDTFCLDFKNMEWTKKKTRGRSPIGRAGHSGTVAGNKWYIVGGESRGHALLKTLVFNLDTREWLELENIRSGSPLASDGISLVRIQSQGRTFAVAFGGHAAKPSNQIFVMLLPPSKESRLTSADIRSNTSSFRSSSFNILDNVKESIVLESVSPLSVRSSNASSGGGGVSSPDSTFSLGEILLRSGRKYSTSGIDSQEVSNTSKEGAEPLGRQLFQTSFTPNEGEEKYQSCEEQQTRLEWVQLQKIEEKSPSEISEDTFEQGSLATVPTAGNLDMDPLPNGMDGSDVSEDLSGSPSVALKLIGDLPTRGMGESDIHGDRNERVLEVLKPDQDLQNRDIHEPTISGDRNERVLVALKPNLDLQNRDIHEPAIIGDLNERLSVALRHNDDLQSRLKQTYDAKLELEYSLNSTRINVEVLEQQVLNLLMSKAEGEWTLKETRAKLEEVGRERNPPSRTQQSRDLKSQSLQGLTRPNSLLTKLFEESAFSTDVENSYETQRRLEEAESKLSALLNRYHVTESKLQTATREKRELSEKAATAMQTMEEARLTTRTLRAENVRLERELLAVKAVLADTQEELEEKQVELAQATSRNFEIQVEMHELLHKFSGSGGNSR